MRQAPLPGLAVAATAALAALKLTRRISWSWWWVLSPAWALAGLIAVLFAGIIVTAAIDRCLSRRRR